MNHLRDGINGQWPRLWTAVTSLESRYLAVSHLGPPYEEQIEFVGGSSDISNADWIVWCMERLEELGSKRQYDFPEGRKKADYLAEMLLLKLMEVPHE